MSRRAPDSNAAAVTADLFERLKRRYSPPEWFSVQNIGLTMGGRIADALAMNLWKSRGLAIHGFEVKSTRADLMRELRNPAKADEIGELCDFWWLVMPVVPDVELPHGWGVLVKSGRGLRAYTKALPINGPPGPNLSRYLACALMKRALRVEVADRQQMRAEIREEQFERGRSSVTLRDDGLREDLARMRERLSDFEEASGLRIDTWRGGRELGEAVAALQHGRLAQLQRMTETALKQAEKLNEMVTAAANALHDP